MSRLDKNIRIELRNEFQNKNYFILLFLRLNCMKIINKMKRLIPIHVLNKTYTFF